MNDYDWDFDSVEEHPPVKDRYAVVSVRMTSEEFEAICSHARAANMKVSAWMRQQCLDGATPGRWVKLTDGMQVTMTS